MLRYLFFSLFIFSQSLSAKVCPTTGYFIHPRGPEKISRDYVVPKCYQKPFIVRGCSQFYDDLICYFTTENGDYTLDYILSGGYGKVDYSNLSFKGAVPPGCTDKTAVTYHKQSDNYVHQVTIKRKDFKFDRVGCTRFEKEGESPYSKYRCRYRGRILKHLELIETVIKGNKARRQSYLIGCK